MPQYPDERFDPAATASRLPEPLRKPGGMALQVLADMLGTDDPMSGVVPPVMGMASQGLRLVKGAATPAAEMLGAEWSQPATHSSARLLEAFRPKDLSNVMPAGPSQVPLSTDPLGKVAKAFREFRGTGMPEYTGGIPDYGRVSDAFSEYGGKLGDLLLRGRK